jgi:hypothetical protein
LRPNIVYARICFLSFFFEWAMRDLSLRELIRNNPARLALPKTSKAYQTKCVKAWTVVEPKAIVQVISDKAAADDIVGKEIMRCCSTHFWRGVIESTRLIMPYLCARSFNFFCHGESD